MKKVKREIKKVKIGIVFAQFNAFITKRLFDACVKELERQGVKKSDMKIIPVPGAFEIPVTALKLAKKKTIDAVIALGAVIRGETYHFELVAQGAAQGISQVSLMTGKPVILGVLTTDTIDQAYKRSQLNGDNKGRDAAQAALEMIEALKKV